MKTEHFKKLTLPADNEQRKLQENTPHANLPTDITKYLDSFLAPKDFTSLAKTSVGLFSHYDYDAKQTTRAMQALLQAVIDYDLTTLEQILTARPDLLLLDPNTLGIHMVTSKYTHQIFETHKPLVMALARNQVKVVKALLPHFHDLEGGVEAALAQWGVAKVILKCQQEYTKGFDFTALIDVIAKETFPNGLEGALSPPTEAILEAFRITVLPKQAVSLEDYFNVEQLLIAAYQAYEAQFDHFQNWDQQALFCVKVIGFYQSVLSPEDAQIFCEGLYDVVKNNQPICERARGLKLCSGEAYYRSFDSLEGLGYAFYCAWGGSGGGALRGRGRPPS